MSIRYDVVWPTSAGMIKTSVSAADPTGLQIILARTQPAPNPHLLMKVPQFASKNT
jgi:hypothetical protein